MKHLEKTRLSFGIFGCVFLLLSVSMTRVDCFGQRAPIGEKARENAKRQANDPEFLKWKIVLDGLVQEAKTAFPEERRPYAIADAASSYWFINEEDSKAQFTTALDKAISLSRSDKKYKSSVEYVISAASRRDASLAKSLIKHLEDQNKDEDDVSNETALDILDENPELAAKIVESLVPNGLTDGTAMFLIFRIATKDPSLSDRVFNTYLTAVRANGSVPVEAAITMAGYALGYSEYYTVGRSGQLVGASLKPVTGLRFNPVLANAYLDLAYRRILSAINSRNNAAGEDITERNFPILFAVAYLLPEVARVAPASLPAWQQLLGQANIGVLAPQTQIVQGIIAQIYQMRERTKSFTDSSQTPEIEAEASLKDVEKLAGTCQRDVVYSKAALLFSSRKNFPRALEITEKIEDLKQNDSVKQAIFIGEADSAIQKGDWVAFREIAEKVSSYEQRAILYVKAASRKSPETDDFIREAIRLTEKIGNDDDRAGVLFSIAGLLVKSDWQEAFRQQSNAIAALNKIEPSDEMRFSIPIRVPLSCGGEGAWWGGSSTLPNSNVFDVVGMLARQYPDYTLRITDEIGDKITKIRSAARVVGIALEHRKKTSSKKKTLTDAQ